MDKNDYLCSRCNNKNCLIRKVSITWVMWLDAKVHTCFIPSGNKVFFENEEVNGIYFIRKGKVKVFSSGMGENEKIFRLAGDGDILGHRGFGATVFPVSATTLEDSVICFLDNQSAKEMFMANPEFAWSMLNFSLDELRYSELNAKHHTQMNAYEKTISAILYIDHVYGSDVKTGMLRGHLSRKDMAAIADASPEEVSRSIALLEKENLIVRNMRKIHLINRPGMLGKLKRFHAFTQSGFTRHPYTSTNEGRPMYGRDAMAKLPSPFS